MKKQISTPMIFAYCLGEFARAIIGGLVVTYSIKFYNVTEASGLPLLLPFGMMGLLRGFGVIFDAITDPWVASLSDKCKNKNGRRIPFMKWSAIPYALTCFMIFVPPANEVSTINIIWVSIMLLCYYMSSTLYNVPYLALQPELITDTKRRVFFYTINSLMYVLGSAIIFVLPVITSVLRANGMEAITAWRISLASFAVIGAICAVIPALVIKEKDYVESKSYYKPIIESIKATFAYKNFTIMTSGNLLMNVGFAFFNTAMLFYIDTLLELKDSFATIVLGLSIVIGVATYPIVNKLVAKVGKKPLLITACFTYIVVYMGIYFYEPISSLFGTATVTNGLLVGLAGSDATTGHVTCAFLIGILIAFPIACTNILPAAAFADMAQYDTIKTGDNKAGMFVAARQFCVKIANALSSMVVSYVMYLGATDNYPTKYGVQLTALIAAVFIFLAVILYFKYDDRMIVSAIDDYNAKKKVSL